MHIIVVNDKDLGFDGNSIEYNHKSGESSKIPTLKLGTDVGDFKNDFAINRTTKRSIPEMIPAFGLLMSIMSVFCFSLASLIVKVLTELHSLEILFIRCSFQLAFYIIPVIYNRHPLFGVPGHRLDLALRAICGTSAAICIFMAYRLIPLADATTIQFTAPVLVIFLAVFILKEPLTLIQVITGFVTLFGVIIIAKPDFIFGGKAVIVNRTEGLIFSVAATFSTASVMLILRKLRTTPLPVVIIWFSIVAMAGSLTILLSMGLWKWPSGWHQYGLLLGIGILGISDQFFMTIALHYESAGPVALTRTLNIVLAFVWDVLVLSEDFDWTSILGACLVTTCITILAISKWKQEKPDQFDNIKNKIFCCTDSANDGSDDECNVLIVRRQSQPYYDSIDDKMAFNSLTPPHEEAMRRNDSFTIKNTEFVMNKNS